MSDSRALLTGLEAYHRSLLRHLETVEAEFRHIHEHWLRLNEVYAGRSADEFRPVWEGTTIMFRDYTSHARAIAAVLARQIEDLRRFDAATGRL